MICMWLGIPECGRLSPFQHLDSSVSQAFGCDWDSPFCFLGEETARVSLGQLAQSQDASRRTRMANHYSRLQDTPGKGHHRLESPRCQKSVTINWVRIPSLLPSPDKQFQTTVLGNIFACASRNRQYWVRFIRSYFHCALQQFSRIFTRLPVCWETVDFCNASPKKQASKCCLTTFLKANGPMV